MSKVYKLNFRIYVDTSLRENAPEDVRASVETGLSQTDSSWIFQSERYWKIHEYLEMRWQSETDDTGVFETLLSLFPAEWISMNHSGEFEAIWSGWEGVLILTEVRWGILQLIKTSSIVSVDSVI